MFSGWRDRISFRRPKKRRVSQSLDEETYGFTIEIVNTANPDVARRERAIRAIALYNAASKHDWISKRFAVEKLALEISPAGDDDSLEPIELDWTCLALGRYTQRTVFMIAPNADFDVLFGPETDNNKHPQQLSQFERGIQKGHLKRISFQQGIADRILLRLERTTQDNDTSAVLFNAMPTLADLEAQLNRDADGHEAYHIKHDLITRQHHGCPTAESLACICAANPDQVFPNDHSEAYIKAMHTNGLAGQDVNAPLPNLLLESNQHPTHSLALEHTKIPRSPSNSHRLAPSSRRPDPDSLSPAALDAAAKTKHTSLKRNSTQADFDGCDFMQQPPPRRYSKRNLLFGRTLDGNEAAKSQSTLLSQLSLQPVDADAMLEDDRHIPTVRFLQPDSNSAAAIEEDRAETDGRGAGDHVDEADEKDWTVQTQKQKKKQRERLHRWQRRRHSRGNPSTVETVLNTDEGVGVGVQPES